jgi:ribosomal protein L18E
MNANVSPDPLWEKDQGVVNADDLVVLAGALLGIAMLAIWVVFVAALVWTRGAG